MILDGEGREYVHWPVSGGTPDMVYEAKFTLPNGTDTDWLPLETVSASEARGLVAGYGADMGAAIVQLPAGRTLVKKIRVVDNPEIVIRGGGEIDVR